MWRQKVLNQITVLSELFKWELINLCRFHVQNEILENLFICYNRKVPQNCLHSNRLYITSISLNMYTLENFLHLVIYHSLVFLTYTPIWPIYIFVYFVWNKTIRALDFQTLKTIIIYIYNMKSNWKKKTFKFNIYVYEYVYTNLLLVK